MNSAIERLLSLRVSDVMQLNVVRLPSYATLAEAAEIFLKHQISGAPVVDERDRCVGILSAMDFVKREQNVATRGALEQSQRRQGPTAMLNVGAYDEERIDGYMTSAVQSIAMDATLIQAAEIMCGAHVHRIPVLDGRARPVGMVSSLDIAAALLQAIEEQSHSAVNPAELVP